MCTSSPSREMRGLCLCELGPEPQALGGWLVGIAHESGASWAGDEDRRCSTSAGSIAPTKPAALAMRNVPPSLIPCGLAAAARRSAAPTASPAGVRALRIVRGILRASPAPVKTLHHVFILYIYIVNLDTKGEMPRRGQRSRKDITPAELTHAVSRLTGDPGSGGAFIERLADELGVSPPEL